MDQKTRLIAELQRTVESEKQTHARRDEIIVKLSEFMSYADIGRECGLTRERVRQIVTERMSNG